MVQILIYLTFESIFSKPFLAMLRFSSWLETLIKPRLPHTIENGSWLKLTVTRDKAIFCNFFSAKVRASCGFLLNNMLHTSVVHYKIRDLSVVLLIILQEKRAQNSFNTLLLLKTLPREIVPFCYNLRKNIAIMDLFLVSLDALFWTKYQALD